MDNSGNADHVPLPYPEFLLFLPRIPQKKALLIFDIQKLLLSL
jgi:hypothetical protein